MNNAMSNLTHADDCGIVAICSESVEVGFILSLRALGSPWGLKGFLNCKTLWFDGWSLTRYDLHSWLGVQHPVTKVCLDRWTPGWCSCWCSREGRCQQRRMRRRRTCCTPWLSSAAPPPSPSCCSSWPDRYAGAVCSLSTSSSQLQALTIHIYFCANEHQLSGAWMCSNAVCVCCINF